MARFLTDNEINQVLSFIEPSPYLPGEISESLVDINRKRLGDQLRKKKIYPCLIPKLREKLKEVYYSSLIQPGESVGILTAQSIGEKQTQSNLNTFHKAGSSENQTDTVSRFAEFLNATKESKNKMCIVYFKHSTSNVSELRKMIGHSIVELNLRKLSRMITIQIDKEDEKWYDIFEVLYDNKFRKYRDCISFNLDVDMLYTYNLSIQEIVDRIYDEYEDIGCVFSTDDIGRLDIFVNTENITLSEEKIGYVTPENMKKVYLRDVVRPILEKLVVAGIAGIQEVFYNKQLKEGKNEWFVETSGSNLSCLLSHPDVDQERVISMNAWDIYGAFGVEATRQFMIEQFANIMSGINICHIMLLVDKMTFRGTLCSISRYTMRKEEGGPLSRATFEETLDNLTNAGVYSQVENVKGVSASIICGKQAKIGTGLCSIKMDLSVVPESDDCEPVLSDVVIEE